MIISLNKKHVSRELLSFKKILFTKKYVDIHKMKECKRNAINKYFFRENLKVEDLFWTFSISSIGDNGHKMQTSFKTLVSMNPGKWRLHQTFG